jgi:hypothetical protein
MRTRFQEIAMRATLILPLIVLAACASTSPKDVEKMSTIDACYMAMMDPDAKAMVDAEMQRRKANCMDHEAELKKMADEEMRAGGAGPATTEAAKPGLGGGPSGGTGGMGRY